jgi:hypothetical protein
MSPAVIAELVAAYFYGVGSGAYLLFHRLYKETNLGTSLGIAVIWPVFVAQEILKKGRSNDRRAKG